MTTSAQPLQEAKKTGAWESCVGGASGDRMAVGNPENLLTTARVSALQPSESRPPGLGAQDPLLEPTPELRCLKHSPPPQEQLLPGSQTPQSRHLLRPFAWEAT